MSWLLDTNVISELRKGPRCNGGVLAWHHAAVSQEVFLSVLVIGELRRGVELKRHNGDRLAAAALERWLERALADYGGRILPISRAIADAWGRMNVADPVPVIDGLLSATALVHDLTLVTRNIAHVERTGARCLNPFTANAPG